jgi:hypothetical protein
MCYVISFKENSKHEFRYIMQNGIIFQIAYNLQ